VLMLFLACGFPVLGGFLLHQFKTVFPQYSVLISEFNISLFILVALIRPSQQISKVNPPSPLLLPSPLPSSPSLSWYHLCPLVCPFDDFSLPLHGDILTCRVFM